MAKENLFSVLLRPLVGRDRQDIIPDIDFYIIRSHAGHFRYQGGGIPVFEDINQGFMDLLDHRLAGFFVLADIAEGLHFDGIIIPAEACFQAETIYPLDAPFFGREGKFAFFRDGFSFFRDLLSLFFHYS